MKKSEKELYTNPIIDEGADPWVIQAGDYYYLCSSDGDRCIYITKASKPHDLSGQLRQRIYQAPEGTVHSHEIWAPELHFAEGRWYIYYAADDGNNENHRMYVLQGGSNEDDPLEGEYSFLGKMSDSTDRWAIDGTLLSVKNQLYFVWSGWEGYENVCQNIYIAKMCNPYTITSPRVCISTPEESWEKVGTPYVNEGPEALCKGDTIHIIYSASGSWTNDYCLGRLTCRGQDVMNPENWIKEGPVFAGTDRVFGPGHASFLPAIEQERGYIVYHAAKRDGSGWDRNIRMQSFHWEENAPVFGSPVPSGMQLEW